MPKSPRSGNKRQGSPSNTSSLHKKANTIDAHKASNPAPPVIAKENSNVSNASSKSLKKPNLDPEKAKAELKEALRVGVNKAQAYHEHMNAFTSAKIAGLADNMDASHQRIVQAMANVPNIAAEHKAAIEQTLKEHKAATIHARDTASKLGQHEIVLKAQEHGRNTAEHLKKLVADPNIASNAKGASSPAAKGSPKPSSAKSKSPTAGNGVSFLGNAPVQKEQTKIASRKEVSVQDSVMTETRFSQFSVNSKTSQMTNPKTAKAGPLASKIGGKGGKSRAAPPAAAAPQAKSNGQKTVNGIQMNTRNKYEAKDRKGRYFEFMPMKALPNNTLQGSVIKNDGTTLRDVTVRKADVRLSGGKSGAQLLQRPPAPTPQQIKGQKQQKPTARDIRESVSSKGKGKGGKQQQGKGKGPTAKGAKGGKSKAQQLSATRTTQPENYRHLDGFIIHQRATYEAQFNPHMGFHECVIRGKSGAGYRCTIYLDDGVTLNNVQINPDNLKPFGTKNVDGPTDWKHAWMPSKLKPVPGAHDLQELQIDWTTAGLPKQIRGTNWAGYHNTLWPSFHRQKLGQTLMCDWSMGGLPKSMSTGARVGNWAKGALEAEGENQQLLTFDWSADGIPAPRNNTKHAWKFNQMHTHRQPELEVNWSVDAIPTKVSEMWSHNWTALHRSMYHKKEKEAGEDKMFLVMDWMVQGVPMEAIGQPWTQNWGGIQAKNIRAARKIQRQNRARLNPLARFRQLTNYRLNDMKGAVQTNMDMDMELNRSKNRKNAGEQLQFARHPENIKNVYAGNLKMAHKKARDVGTNKAKKEYKREAYRGRMKDLIRKVDDKRQWKKKKMQQAREGKWQLRAGLRYSEMSDSNVFFRKADNGFNATSIHLGETHFVYEQRNAYEAMDSSGKWWDCVVKASMGDGNYIISVPIADGTTYRHMQCHRNQIRPHLFHNIKGMYEAVDDDGVYWDVVINGHLKNGELNIHVVANSGAEYPELKTHWGKVRLKLHFNTPHLYQAIDRQGYAWSIVLTRDLGNDLYAFDCYSGNEKVMENLRVHRDDIRLDGSHMYLSHMNHDDLKQSGLLPKQSSQHSFKHEVLKQKVAPLRAPVTPPMPTHAPPKPSDKQRAPVERKGTKRKYEDDAGAQPPAEQQETKSFAWLLQAGGRHTVKPMGKKYKFKQYHKVNKTWGINIVLTQQGLQLHEKALVKGQKSKKANKSLGDMTWMNYMPTPAPQAAPKQKGVKQTKKAKQQKQSKPAPIPLKQQAYNWGDKQDVSPSYRLPPSPNASHAYAGDETWMNVLGTPTKQAAPSQKKAAAAPAKPNQSLKKNAVNPTSPTRKKIQSPNPPADLPPKNPSKAEMSKSIHKNKKVRKAAAHENERG